MGEIIGIAKGQAIMVLVLLLIPAVATYVLILALKPVLQRYALARPNARSSHSHPTPQGAGIAVISVIVAGSALATLIPGLDTGFLASVLIPVVILAIVGAVDDVQTLEAFPRLAVQSIAVLIVIATLSRQIQILPFVPLWLERVVLFVGLLWFVNLVNFMDGIDWITVAEIVPLTAALALFGLFGGLPAHATVIALIMCGAMIGFTPLNRPVAQFFLGDVGSLPLGLLLGWLLIMLAKDHLAAAFLLPLYYLADGTITLVLRFLRGERIMQAHRSHFYQLAMIAGMSVYMIVGRILLLNLALIVLAATTLINNTLVLHIASIAVGGTLVGWQLYALQRTVPAVRREPFKTE